MNLLVTGASGLIGSALVPFVTAGGHQVVRLPRGSTEIPPGIQGVVHLAGESIAGRWNAAKKARILESRRVGTRRLCESLARMKTPPRVLVCSSAVGFYGNRGDTILTEESTGGAGFLADVCRAWEDGCGPAREGGIRVVNLRTGVVLSEAGGALCRMVPPFRMGFGGRMGNGRQWMSWIMLDDMVRVIVHALLTESLEGPVNAVAPGPATNADFTRALARVLGRRAIISLPAFLLRLALGEAADEMLLAGQRVEPSRLRESGYTWRHPELEEALAHILGRPGPRPTIG